MDDSKIVDILYNEGERLVPFKTHGEDEMIRHFSSYQFFCDIISRDILSSDSNGISILDVGSGCGYGSFMLSKVKNVTRVTGVDVSPECKEYSEKNFWSSNIEYITEDAAFCIGKDQEYDYITSRGVLEHILDGIEIIGKSKFLKRLIFDVPYDEKPGNKHHSIIGIKEENFRYFNNLEFFYEGLDGTIYDVVNKPENVNMILLVQSAPEIQPVSKMFKFPIPPASMDDIKMALLTKSEIDSGGRQVYFYDNPSFFIEQVKRYIEKNETVLEIGPGIKPMDFYRPKLHILVEPFQEYVEILEYRYANVKSVIIISAMAQEMVPRFGTNSVDSVFMLDFIEHTQKSEGIDILRHAERIARRQVVIFTPLDFIPQDGNHDKKDAWGLSGAEYQKHLSGWVPTDFKGEWFFHICKKFHTVDGYGNKIMPPHGAFFAIKTLRDKPTLVPETLSDIRYPLPSEILLDEARSELSSTHAQLTETQLELASTRDQLAESQIQLAKIKLQQSISNSKIAERDAENAGLQRIVNHPVIRLQRKVWGFFKL